jgi:hypothetical protein
MGGHRGQALVEQLDSDAVPGQQGRKGVGLSGGFDRGPASGAVE